MGKGLSDEDACYALAAWRSGTSQLKLGRQFGYKTGYPVGVGIRRFLHKWHPRTRDFDHLPYPEANALSYATASEAIKAFVCHRTANAKVNFFG